KNFQSNFAIEFHVLSQIHFAHSALANLRADFVAAEFCAGSKSHRLNPLIMTTFVSCARCTLPMPPAPSFETRRYCERVVLVNKLSIFALQLNSESRFASATPESAGRRATVS